MGNCESATKQQIANDLESSLKGPAKNLLANDFGQALSDGTSLESYLEAIAKAAFKKEFKYDWSLKDCSPPNKLASVKSVTDFCIIDQDHNLTKELKSYVDEGLSSASLSSWIKVKAAADLATTIGNCASNACDNNWYYKPWMETYNASDTTMDSYQGDMMIVYTNATRTESAVEVTLHILYFVAVYYDVKSPTKEAFGDLQTAAYTAAGKLDNSTVNSDLTLQTALHKYSTPLFKSKWEYDYETGKPSDFPTDESNAIYTKTPHLCYFQSKSTVPGFMDHYIESNIMDGLAISIPTAHDAIKNDIKANLQEAISDPDSGQWNIKYIDKKYELHKAGENPLRMNALVVQWYDSKSLEIDDTDGKKKDVTVEMIYLYFLGVVYELAHDKIDQDLRQKLSKNIPNITLSSLPSKITPTQFRTYVETYNRSKFKADYGIDFPIAGTAGSKKEKHWSVFFEFPSWGPSDDAIKEAVGRKLFESDYAKDPEIKHGKQAEVYKFIVDYIKYYSGTSYIKSDNQWYGETKKKNFSYKVTSQEWDLDARTSCAFANGTMTEDGDGGETIKRFYLSLLLYITAEKVTEAADEV